MKLAKYFFLQSFASIGKFTEIRQNMVENKIFYTFYREIVEMELVKRNTW